MQVNSWAQGTQGHTVGKWGQQRFCRGGLERRPRNPEGSESGNAREFISKLLRTFSEDRGNPQMYVPYSRGGKHRWILGEPSSRAP